MSLQELITDVRAGWSSYRSLKIVSKYQDEFKLVVEEFPRELERFLPTNLPYEVQGSTGQGNITAAPWIATFDPTVTRTATQGFYLVYLFSVDLQRLYLSIAFGTTQFESYFPQVRERHAKLVAAAEHLRALS
jgi:MrcB-like, N-terminal domain